VSAEPAVVSANGSGPSDRRLASIGEEAARLVRQVPGPLRQLVLRMGDCSVEITWADHVEPSAAPPVPAVAGAAGPATHHGGDGLTTIVAPLVGVFYVASSPGAKPFVQPGNRVGLNQTVGIIEAMKLMNHITSDVSGTVTEVLVENGQAVEFGQELVRIMPDADSF
jgi:acetyl-CoA carboxylase biotin carboxyl carrier protein